MYIFLMIVHVIVCFVLITVVLFQAGRGGGFSEMVGGAQPQSIFGTQTNAFMTRATEVCAVLFIVTSLSLGILSTQRGKSLMQTHSVTNSVKTVIPATTSAEPVKAEAAKTVEAVQSVEIKTPEVSPVSKAGDAVKN